MQNTTDAQQQHPDFPPARASASRVQRVLSEKVARHPLGDVVPAFGMLRTVASFRMLHLVPRLLLVGFFLLHSTPSVYVVMHALVHHHHIAHTHADAGHSQGDHHTGKAQHDIVPMMTQAWRSAELELYAGYWKLAADLFADPGDAITVLDVPQIVMHHAVEVYRPPPLQLSGRAHLNKAPPAA